jgi:hypothetical protein
MTKLAPAVKRNVAVTEALETLPHTTSLPDTALILEKLYNRGVQDAFEVCTRVINAYPSSG